MDIFKLYRYFWDFAFSNPELIKPNHCAVYSFSIEHCNRLGWKAKFGFPSSMAMEATGIKSYSVYKKTFDDLVEYGFFTVIQYSKNQYSSNIIALKENYKALDKALDKALTTHLTKHDTKQSESTVQSNDSINKPTNKKQRNIKPINQETNFDQLFENVEISENRKLLLTDWLLYKAERKETYKPRGFKMLVKILSEYSDEIVQKAIEASISSNWSGLFPEKVIINKVKPQGYTPPPKPVEIRNEANNWGISDYQRRIMGEKDFQEAVEYYKEQSTLNNQ